MQTIKENFKNNIFSSLGIFGILIFIGIVFLSMTLKSGMNNISILTNAQGITVSGTAEKVVTSDKASIFINLTSDNPNLADKDSIKKMVDARDTLIKILINEGIKSEDIDVLSLTNSMSCTMRDKNYWENCLGKKYNIYSQAITISSSDVNKIKDLSLNLNSKLNYDKTNESYFNSVNVSITNTQYLYTKLSEIKTEMLNEATRNAFERADSIAKSTNNRAGEVITASQGVFQITAKDSTDSSDYGMYDTSTIDKKITAVVRVSFKVK